MASTELGGSITALSRAVATAALTSAPEPLVAGLGHATNARTTQAAPYSSASPSRSALTAAGQPALWASGTNGAPRARRVQLPGGDPSSAGTVPLPAPASAIAADALTSVVNGQAANGPPKSRMSSATRPASARPPSGRSPSARAPASPSLQSQSSQLRASSPSSQRTGGGGTGIPAGRQRSATTNSTNGAGGSRGRGTTPRDSNGGASFSFSEFALPPFLQASAGSFSGPGDPGGPRRSGASFAGAPHSPPLSAWLAQQQAMHQQQQQQHPGIAAIDLSHLAPLHKVLGAYEEEEEAEAQSSARRNSAPDSDSGAGQQQDVGISVPVAAALAHAPGVGRDGLRHALSGGFTWQPVHTVARASVAEHEQRLYERVEVTSSLRKWAEQVLGAAAAGGGGSRAISAVLEQHIDAEQLDLGDEQPHLSAKPDPRGLGAQLRAHFMAEVQREVEARYEAMRSQWDEEVAVEMDELAELRDSYRELRKAYAEVKEQLDRANTRLEMLRRQVKLPDGAPDPGAAAAASATPSSPTAAGGQPASGGSSGGGSSGSASRRATPDGASPTPPHPPSAMRASPSPPLPGAAAAAAASSLRAEQEANRALHAHVQALEQQVERLQSDNTRLQGEVTSAASKPASRSDSPAAASGKKGAGAASRSVSRKGSGSAAVAAASKAEAAAAAAGSPASMAAQRELTKLQEEAVRLREETRQAKAEAERQAKALTQAGKRSDELAKEFADLQRQLAAAAQRQHSTSSTVDAAQAAAVAAQVAATQLSVKVHGMEAQLERANRERGDALAAADSARQQLQALKELHHQQLAAAEAAAAAAAASSTQPPEPPHRETATSCVQTTPRLVGDDAEGAGGAPAQQPPSPLLSAQGAATLVAAVVSGLSSRLPQALQLVPASAGDERPTGHNAPEVPPGASAEVAEVATHLVEAVLEGMVANWHWSLPIAAAPVSASQAMLHRARSSSSGTGSSIVPPLDLTPLRSSSAGAGSGRPGLHAGTAAADAAGSVRSAGDSARHAVPPPAYVVEVAMGSGVGAAAGGSGAGVPPVLVASDGTTFAPQAHYAALLPQQQPSGRLSARATHLPHGHTIPPPPEVREVTLPGARPSLVSASTVRRRQAAFAALHSHYLPAGQQQQQGEDAGPGAATAVIPPITILSARAVAAHAREGEMSGQGQGGALVKRPYSAAASAYVAAQQQQHAGGAGSGRGRPATAVATGSGGEGTAALTAAAMLAISQMPVRQGDGRRGPPSPRGGAAGAGEGDGGRTAQAGGSPERGGATALVHAGARVRTIAATPQKGIQITARPRGQPPPPPAYMDDDAPPPNAATTAQRQPGVGLMPPIKEVQLHTGPGAATATMLVPVGEEGEEALQLPSSAAELAGLVRMLVAAQGAAHHELELQEAVRRELADEVAASRQQWLQQAQHSAALEAEVAAMRARLQ